MNSAWLLVEEVGAMAEMELVNLQMGVILILDGKVILLLESSFHL